MGKCYGKEADCTLANMLPPSFCVGGHGNIRDFLLDDKECKVIISVYGGTEFYDKYIKIGKLLKMGRRYIMNVAQEGCEDRERIVHPDKKSFEILNTANNEIYYGAAIIANGKLFIFIEMDITHRERCVYENASEILRLIYEVYHIYKQNYPDYVNKINANDLLLIKTVLESIRIPVKIPRIKGKCINSHHDIEFDISENNVFARFLLNFNIEKYICADTERREEYKLPQQPLIFRSYIGINYNITNTKLDLIGSPFSYSRFPITINGENEKKCHENIDSSNGKICLGTAENKIETIDLRLFDYDLCRALDYVASIIESTLKTPNVCSRYQVCPAARDWLARRDMREDDTEEGGE